MAFNWIADREVLQEVADYYQPISGPVVDPVEAIVSKTEVSLEHLRADHPVRSFPLMDIARGNFEKMVCQAWWVNCQAKQSFMSWYDIKDALLRALVSRAPKEAPAEWGLGFNENGREVLYFDLPGHGQVSFHVFWEWEILADVPRYPFGWTEVRNVKFGWRPLRRCHLMINLRDYRNGNHGGWSRGEIHNQFVRTGLDPAPLWAST